MSSKSSRRFTPAELIPEWWRLSVPDIDKLVWLGQITIREMVRHWRGDAQRLVHEVKNIERRLSEIEGLNPRTIKAAAAKFENPAFPSIGTREGNWTHDPEPTDAASVNRKSDATTFNVCGWCKYASGGSCRYNYYITTSCGLRRQAGLTDVERKFNTPCHWLSATQYEWDMLKAGLMHRKGLAIAEKTIVDQKIQTLLELEKQAEKKPALPDIRPHDWFNENDPVTCYVANWKSKDKKVASNQFVTGKVIHGYRHHDGCVSVRYDERVHTGEYLDGHGGGYGMARPEVMHTWEFDYMLTHWDFMSFWLARGDQRSLEGFSPKDMSGAFVAETIKRERSTTERGN